MRNLIEEYGYFVITVIVASAVIVSIVLGVAIPQMTKYTEKCIAGDYTGGASGSEDPSGGGSTEPTAVWNGLIYENGDYIYKYNYKFEYASNVKDSDWAKDTTMDAWGVRLKDITKEPSSEPLTSIAGEPVQPLAEPQIGFEYEDGDYVYRYNQFCYGSVDSWQDDPEQNGWGVRVKDTSKTSYGEILSSISGKPIVNMGSTFQNCWELVTAPSIPNGVINMGSAFSDCDSLTTVPTIPRGVTNIEYTFYSCDSLTTAPAIPESVVNMDSAFLGCGALTTAPIIPSSVTDMTYAFAYCFSLTTAPAIPSSVTNMEATFAGCESLTAAPEIPNGVTNMKCTFDGCFSLAGTIEINANPTQYAGCLSGTQITEVTGSTTLKAEILATK